MAIINTLNPQEKRVIHHPQETPEVRHPSDKNYVSRLTRSSHQRRESREIRGNWHVRHV